MKLLSTSPYSSARNKLFVKANEEFLIVKFFPRIKHAQLSSESHNNVNDFYMKLLKAARCACFSVTMQINQQALTYN